MTFLKSVKSAVMLAGIAGVLIFAGGAWAEAALTLNPNTKQIWTPVTVGYAAQTAKTINVKNSGDADFATLTVALTDTTDGEFTLGDGSVDAALEVDDDFDVTITPVPGLAVGTYSGKLTVSQGAITASVEFEFTVNGATAAPALTLSPNTKQTWTPVAVGYAAQTAKTINVKNSGDADFTALTVTLTDTTDGEFTLGDGSVDATLAVDDDFNVTITPAQGLTADTYSGKLTVSQGAITASVEFEFTVEGSTPTHSVEPTFSTNLSTSKVTYLKDAAAAALTVTAAVTDGGTLSYEWYKNSENNTTSGTKITDAATASYTPSTADVGNAYYYVIVKNTKGSLTPATATSHVAHIAVEAPKDAETPEFDDDLDADDHIASVAVNADPSSVRVWDVLATVADGGTITYQWYKSDTQNGDGTAISGATSRTYTPIVTEVGTSWYYVIATNTNNNATGSNKMATAKSFVAKCVVDNLTHPAYPHISSNLTLGPVSYNLNTPVEQVTALTVTATVSASGNELAGELSYQWYSNSEPHNANGTAINGATTNSYKPSVDVAGNYYYYVVVSNFASAATAESKTAHTSSDVAWVKVIDPNDVKGPVAITFGVKGNVGGTLTAVDGNGDEFVSLETAEEDEVITFTAVAAAGYKVKNWYVDDVVQPLAPVVPTTFEYTVTAVPAKIEVEFEAAGPNALTATFTASANGTVSATFNGSAILSGATVSNAGDLVITAAAASDYEIDVWTLSIGGTPITGASLTGLLSNEKKTLTIQAASITGSVIASVTFKTEGGSGSDEAIALEIRPQPTATQSIVEGNILSTNVLTSGAHVIGQGSTPALTAAIQYRWFKPTSNSNAGTTDEAAIGSSWATAADGGAVYTLPTDLKATPAVGSTPASNSTNYYYCRARVTVKAADGVTDSVMMVSSNVAIVIITPQPVANLNGVTPTGPITFVSQDANSIAGSRTLTASGAAITPSEPVAYRWFRNRTNSDQGGVVITGATSSSYVVPVDLEPGYYFYYCEINNAKGTAKVKTSNVVAVTVNPKQVAGKELRALPPQNIVQFSGASVDYTYATDMKLTIPAAAANLVAPAIGSTKFEVTKIIYEGTLGKATGVKLEFEKGATDAAKDITKQKVESAGTYIVTVVVTATSTVNVTEGTPAAQVAVTYVGSTQVTYVVREKDIGSIMNKTISMPDAVYSGFTKDPVLTLVDGDSKKNTPLVGSIVDGAAAVDYWRVNGNLTDAGTAVVTIHGRGNYTGKTELSFAITKKVITVNSAATITANITTSATGTTPAVSRFDKPYDGTTTVTPSGDVNVRFSGLVDETHQNGTAGFTVSGLAFNDANAGTKSVTGTVTLDPTTVLGRNYSFANGTVSASFTQTGVTISKRDPVKDDFAFTIPDFRRFTGVAQSIGAVGWKAPVASTGDTRTVYYDAGQGMGPETKLPVEAGNYTVSVSVSGSNNFNNGTVTLGTFTINPAGVPTVAVTTKNDSATMSDINAYVGEALTLRAIGFRPDSATVRNAANDGDSTLWFKGGTLSYIWFLDTAKASRWDTLKTNNGRTVVTGPTYTVTYPNQTPPSWKYRVEATYTNPSAQVATKSAEDVGVVVVTVHRERIDVAAATVTVDATPVYNGKTPVIEVGKVTVKLRVDGKDSTLVYDKDGKKDYTFDVFGEEAGVGVVSVKGTNGFKGMASGTFTIEKALTTEDSLKYTPASTSVPYNGKAQPITVAPKTGDGLGAVKITYINIDDEDNPVTLTAAPKNAGSYNTLIEIAEGKNYTELEEFERPYTITKRFAVKEDFNYTMPKNGATPAAITATLKDPMGYTGTLTTVYVNAATQANLNAVPTTEGKYAVRVRVGGDDNFGMVVVTLDTLKIDENGKVGVNGSDREVPKSVETNVAAVAPVSVVASGFTAGPSPVSLSKDGAVKFFSAKSVKSGTLYIFDANGNSVAKKSVKSGSGEIGGWNLKDKKGAAVSEGTYVVKGALVGKDGKKEKVSFPFSVVK